MFERVEHLEQMDPARTRWWKRNHLIASISRGDGFAQLHSVRGKIRGCHEAPVRLHPGSRGFREWAAIEPICSLLAQRPIGFGQVGLLEDVTGFQRFAVLEETPARVLKLCHVVRALLQSRRISWHQNESFRGELRSRREQLAEL